MPTRSPRAKAASGSARARQPNPALQKPLQPSAALAAVVGAEPLPRAEVVSRVWAYIKAQGLQNPEDRREIVADERFRPVFGRDRVTLFELNKDLAQQLT